MKLNIRPPGKPPRLRWVFQDYQAPLYFVTITVEGRASILACDPMHAAFQHNAKKSASLGSAVGRYVIMPDHIHLFVRVGGENRLGDHVRFLKTDLRQACRLCERGKTAEHSSAATQAGSSAATQGAHISLPCSCRSVSGSSSWQFQRGFFDHLIRHAESYHEKWDYVWQSPVRAGYVLDPEHWPYRGEITCIHHQSP